MKSNLLDCKAMCRKVGGTKPVHPSTLYRLIRKGGLVPKPVKIGGSSRWIEDEVDTALAALAVRR
jgi:predicted DNA-binding transcriptional regulator AlpA